MAPLCEVDSSTTPSSREAQPEIRNAIAKSETAYGAKRGIIGTNLASDTFDASRVISCIVSRSRTLLFLQKRQERFVTFVFHLFDWNEMEGGRVNGVTLFGGPAARIFSWP